MALCSSISWEGGGEGGKLYPEISNVTTKNQAINFSHFSDTIVVDTRLLVEANLFVYFNYMYCTSKFDGK